MLTHNSVHILGVVAKSAERVDGVLRLTVDTVRLGPGNRRLITDRITVRVEAFAVEAAASFRPGQRVFIDGTLQSTMRVDPDSGKVTHLVEVVGWRFEGFREGVRQDAFNALRRQQQRDREAEAFIRAVTSVPAAPGDQAQ